MERSRANSDASPGIWERRVKYNRPSYQAPTPAFQRALTQKLVNWPLDIVTMSDFNVFADSLALSSFVIFVVSTPLCTIATALRFVASRYAAGKPRIEDWLALGALAFLLAWIGICIQSICGRPSPMPMA